MKTMIFIVAAMFYLLLLFSVTFTMWQDLLIAGITGVAMGWSLSE